ncbi:MAG: TetR/AcrR family transcriptional regulator [Calditrichaeota bacterium]|nr:TetR/AcrR family transcriptional regulator [Calditrichota bacterium]
MAVRHRKERERLARQQLILDAAIQVFSRKGFHQATMDDVAQEAELGKGTLYYYFRSKDEILQKLLEDNTRRFFDQIIQAIASEKSFIQMVRKVLLFYASYFTEHKTFFNIYFPFESGQIQFKSPGFSNFRQTYFEYRKPLEEKLFQKMREEKIRTVDPRNFWRILGGIIMGINLEIYRETPLTEIIHMIDQLTAIFEQGLK